MGIKKNFSAPLASGLGATRRAAVLLLVMMLTTATAWAADVTLSGSENYTAQDGDVLTGSTSGTVTIASDASITLSDATITGGIVCEGSATITLVGTNSVTGFSGYDPNIGAYRCTAGIQIGGSGTTLTINGDGTLTANGGNQSAGIGLSLAWNVTEDVVGGNIVIEGGTITATGGGGGAGIGAGVIKDTNNSSSRKAIVGNITIAGGSVTAVGGSNADGIGAGQNDYNATIQIGTVTIYDGINMVDASSIKDFASVVYMHGETDVTASKTEYFNISENGDRRIIVPKDDTDYTITIADGIEHGTLTVAAATAKYMETVTINATPDFGYRLVRLVVKDAQNNDVALTGNTFQMPKTNVTVSAEFEQGVHGTTEFKLMYREEGLVLETIYDGVTTVNIQNIETSYNILKIEEPTYYEFLLDNDTQVANIPYAGGTGEFNEIGIGNVTDFRIPGNGQTGYYDITLTDVGIGKWSVSILKTVPQMDVIPDQTYTGSAITPEPLVIAGSLSLTKDEDYEYSYTNNTNVGTATVTVTFIGDYESLGSVEKTFNIVFAPSDWADNGDGSYTIGSTLGWSIFCDALQDNDTWNRFSGKTVKLGGDIGTAQAPITRMAGSQYHDFCGTFDGQGHTLNVNLNGAQYVAPFFYVKSQDNDHPATIQNLKVSGTVTASGKFAAGIAGGCGNVVNITNCLVDVTINSSVNGDGTHGGLVGVFDGGTLNITGCAFTGKLLSIGSGATTKCGGIVGYSHVSGTAVNITNSLYAPAALDGSETEPTSESMTFLRSTNTTVTITNSYYTRTLGDAQGSPVPVPTFAPEGYATFYSSVLDVVVPEGMKARIVTGSADGGKLTYQDVADGDAEVKTVPAGTAVMLQVEAGTTAGSLGYDIGTDDRDFTTAEGNDDGWVNLLHGSDVATTTTGGAKYYKLSYNDGYTNDNKVIGWYWGADGGAAFESGANKAWLALGETLAGARFFGLPEYGETTTAVFDLNNKEEIIDNKWYDLQGRCVERSMFNVPRNATLSKRERSTLQKGVYIVNGKKIVIK